MRENRLKALECSILAILKENSVRSLNATKKPFEARVTLLSRYSLLQKKALP